MRGLTTALVVAGVALVGVLAAADALRGGDPDPAPTRGATTTAPPGDALVATLREELVFGLVHYSDADCQVHTLVLPRMLDQVHPDGPRCRLDSTDGRIHAERERLSPNWRFLAECRQGEIVVRDANTGAVRRRIAGCEPEWRPRFGNRLTWARGQTVYDSGRPLYTRDDLHAIARRHPNVADLAVPFRVRVLDLAWLDFDHPIVTLEIRARFAPREYIAALLEGRQVIGQATTFQDRIGSWFASSAGSFAASSGGMMLTAEGDSIAPPPQLPAGRAVAFSPDERWLAHATGRNVYLVGTPRNNEPGKIIRIPVPAQDLTWEPITATPAFP